MNERIRELAEQALGYAEKNQSADIPQHWFKLYNEKFAELIVWECVRRSAELGQPEIGQGLMKHFGVEE